MSKEARVGCTFGELAHRSCLDGKNDLVANGAWKVVDAAGISMLQIQGLKLPLTAL
jgi:hypothetical protein